MNNLDSKTVAKRTARTPSVRQDHIDRSLRQWAAARPDLDTSPARTFARITRLARHRERVLGEHCLTFGITYREYDVLATLRRSGPAHQLTPTALFRSLLITSGTMTNRIDRLEKSGLVSRSSDPADRRGILVGLTDAGLQLVDTMVGSLFTSERELLGSLTWEEEEILALLLRKLLVSIEPVGTGDKDEAPRDPDRC